MGAAPRASRVPRGRVEHLWLEVQGRRTHARIATGYAPGSATPVVLVHGLLVSSRYMAPLVAHLAPWTDVFAPDLPGFGLSEPTEHVLDVPELADALAAWMDRAGLARASLIANSFGCQIAAHFGVRHAERVERIVLQGPSTDSHARSALIQIARWAACGLYEPWSIIPVIFQDYIRAGARAFVDTYRFMLADRIEEQLQRVHVPTLVVAGANDTIVPRRWAEELVSVIPCGELKILPGCAHALNFSAPLELVRVALPFLRGASSIRARRGMMAA